MSNLLTQVKSKLSNIRFCNCSFHPSQHADDVLGVRAAAFGRPFLDGSERRVRLSPGCKNNDRKPDIQMRQETLLGNQKF